jgi:hypothetical protein
MEKKKSNQNKIHIVQFNKKFNLYFDKTTTTTLR